MGRKFPLVVQCRTRYKQKYANRDPERKPSENANTFLEAFPIMTPPLFCTGSPEKLFQSYLASLFKIL